MTQTIKKLETELADDGKSAKIKLNGETALKVAEDGTVTAYTNKLVVPKRGEAAADNDFKSDFNSITIFGSTIELTEKGELAVTPKDLEKGIEVKAPGTENEPEAKVEATQVETASAELTKAKDNLAEYKATAEAIDQTVAGQTEEAETQQVAAAATKTEATEAKAETQQSEETAEAAETQQAEKKAPKTEAKTEQKAEQKAEDRAAQAQREINQDIDTALQALKPEKKKGAFAKFKENRAAAKAEKEAEKKAKEEAKAKAEAKEKAKAEAEAQKQAEAEAKQKAKEQAEADAKAQAAFEKKQAAEAETQAKVAAAIAEAKADPNTGKLQSDGTIYFGKSPDNGKAMFAAPADSPAAAFKDAAKQTKEIEIGDKKDFTLPSPAELQVLYALQDTGALAGTFNKEAKAAKEAIERGEQPKVNTAYLTSQFLSSEATPKTKGVTVIDFDTGNKTNGSQHSSLLSRAIRYGN